MKMVEPLRVSHITQVAKSSIKSSTIEMGISKVISCYMIMEFGNPILLSSEFRRLSFCFYSQGLLGYFCGRFIQKVFSLFVKSYLEILWNSFESYFGGFVKHYFENSSSARRPPSGVCRLKSPSATVFWNYLLIL